MDSMDEFSKAKYEEEFFNKENNEISNWRFDMDKFLSKKFYVNETNYNNFTNFNNNNNNNMNSNN